MGKNDVLTKIYRAVLILSLTLSGGILYHSMLFGELHNFLGAFIIFGCIYMLILYEFSFARLLRNAKNKE